jgi:hypothetical protein
MSACRSWSTACDQQEVPSATGNSHVGGIRRRIFEEACERAGFRHSRRLRCVDFEWSILGNDSTLVAFIEYLYESSLVGSAGPAKHVFVVRRHTNVSSAPVSLYRDSHAVLRRVPEDLAVAQLAWEVNRGVVDEAGNRLLLHAAAAERDGRIVILAGPEGSGKSTLVAALVRSGLRYVTDETVAVPVPAGTIVPYPKPIALHETEQCQRLVPAQAIRSDAVAKSGGTARLLLLLAGYEPGRAPVARSISRAEAAVALAEQAFNFRDLGPGRLDALAEVVRACSCYRLEVGDLDAGCRLVHELFETAVASR